ncbi:disease resistance-like protein DSC1 [Populus alba x Populus x berolinensis]|nr:disease resistance-like protein DSC1 [Populus alba x Populus x berolinensis]
MKHDVFISFRGTDTRYSFTSHLYDALQRKQIDAYIDDKLDGGEKIEPAILEGIEESFISVVIFSENYADSTFCLRELSKILECMETKQQMVLPVFYRLDPCQVQNLTGSYGDALCKHEKDCGSKEVESWRHALKEIANLKGWNSNVIKDEIKLIEEIVSDIQKKLHHEPSPSIDAERLVGMKSRVKDIDSLLSFGSTGVLIVGIWGMGGVGKSTAAEAVYHRNCSKFEGHCFFQNVREESQKHGIDHVRQEILGEVLEKKDMTIRTKVVPPAIKRMLQRKKVLIVLDDVNDPQVLKYLVGEDAYMLNFKQNNPIEGYIGLSKTVVSCVKGIPLVLEVLGASLYRKTSVEYWESKVAQLRTNGGEDIKKCLEMCYHELDQTQKKIFLDIACFFGRCKRDLLQQTLDLEERSGIDRLIDMCLIKIVQNKIWMHDMLLKLGKKIVLQEHVDPRERSRLWKADDVNRVLTTQGTRKVESIFLNLLAITKEMILSPTAFEGMSNLRLLKFYYPPFFGYPLKERIMNRRRVRIHLPQGLHFLSNELRILHWYNYPLKSLPANFCPEKLVEFHMHCSQLEQLWNEFQPLENLEVMNIRSSSKLSLSDSDLSKFPNLEVLNLGQCSGLAGLPSFIKYTTRLTELILYRCDSLSTLPSSIGCLSQLVKLNLIFCRSLASLPESIELCLSNFSKLTSLPYNIGKLKCLVKLNLSYFSKLASLPDCFGQLKSLVLLHISFCPKLVSLPNSIGQLKCLAELNLSGCSELANLPNSIYYLESLKWLNLERCYMLNKSPVLNPRCSEVEEIAFGGCLQYLNLGASGVSEIPGSIGSLVSLRDLRLSCNDFERIPANIKQLPMLIKLDLHGCERLQHLPELPSSLQVLIASYCISLRSLASIFIQGEKGYVAASQQFSFSNCLKLDQNACTRIMEDAHLRIRRMASSLFNREYFGKPIRVRLCIPGVEVPEWFCYQNTGPSLNIPAHWHRIANTDQFLGFTFCAVVSFGHSKKKRPVNIRCECHLITQGGNQSDLNFYCYEEVERKEQGLWERDHVFIWSINSNCFFKEASFHFKPLWGTADVVKCGVHPLRRLKVCLLSSDRIFECLWSLVLEVPYDCSAEVDLLYSLIVEAIDSRSQGSNQRLQANMLIGFDIETPSTFVLTFSLSDFVLCSGLKTQNSTLNM